jgi:hypothetical protein
VTNKLASARVLDGHKVEISLANRGQAFDPDAAPIRSARRLRGSIAGDLAVANVERGTHQENAPSWVVLDGAAVHVKNDGSARGGLGIDAHTGDT